jgi:integrase/recombinase XerC
MPSLFKRSNGIYYFSYIEDGKRKWRSTGQRYKPAALKELLAFEEGRKEPLSNVTLQAFIKDFLSYAEVTYARKTLTVYDRALHHFANFIGDVLLASITARDVDLHRMERMKAVSPVSVNLELRTLRAAFYTALRWGLLSENPFKKVPLVPIPEQQPTYLSKEEFQRLLGFVREPWLREIFLIAVCTGLRRGELLNLTWKDVDFERRLLTIQSGETFRTKAGKRRSVPMSQAVHRLLLARAQRAFGEYVFTVNGRRIVEYFVSHKFKVYVRAAGLSEKLHFHSLRHTFATWLVQDGVNIYEVQKLLGHSNISVTQIYSHLASSQLHTAVERISVPLN